MRNFTKRAFMMAVLMLLSYTGSVYAQDKARDHGDLPKEKVAAKFDRINDLSTSFENKDFVPSRDAILSEGFETWPPTGWAIESPTGDNWEQGDGTYFGPGAAYEGSSAAMYDNWNISSGDEGSMTTPAFDVSGLDNPVVSFYWWNDGSSYTPATIEVLTSTDGANFTSVEVIEAYGSGSSWVEQNLAIDTDVTHVRLTATSDYGVKNTFVDAFEIKELNLNPEIAVNYSSWNAGLLENGMSESFDEFVVFNSNENAVDDLNFTSATLEGSGAFSTSFDVAAANDAMTTVPDEAVFTLSLFDSWGDGWNGASIDVLVNGTVVLDDITVAGSQADFSLLVENGDLVETEFTSGSYDSECSYTFYNNFGDEIITDGPNPTGISFTAEPLPGTYMFGFTYEPTEVGEQTATLTIESNGGTQEIELVGYAYAAGSMVESFEEGVPPNGWEANILNGTYNWEQAAMPAIGEHSAMFNAWSAPEGASAELITPQLDLTAKSDNMLYFYYGHPTTNAGYEDMLEVHVSEDNGETWTMIDEIMMQDMNWHLMSYDLSDYSGDEFKVKFVAISDYGQDILIDHVVTPKLVNGNLTGYVYDLYTGDPIEGATVTLGTQTDMSNSFGQYAIEQIPIGTYTVTCEFPGYNTITEEIVITSDNVTTHDFNMDREAQFSVNVDDYAVTLEPDQSAAKTFTISNDAEVGAANLDYDVSLMFYDDTRDVSNLTQGDLSKALNFAEMNRIEGSFGENAELEGIAQDGTRADLFCSPESVFSNDASGYAGASTSEEDPGYVGAQQFMVSDPFNTVTVWGINAMFNGSWVNCEDENPMTFEVIVYEDGGDTPGTAVSSTIMSVEREGTGEFFAGAFEVYQYTLTIPRVNMSSGWISVQGQTGDSDCWFLWTGGGSGTGDAVTTDGSGWAPATYAPFSLCLSNTVSETWLTVTDGASGSIAPGESADVDLFFDAAGLVDVTKNADIVITHNGVVNDKEMESTIPAEMTVTPFIHDLSIFDIQFTTDPEGNSPVVDSTVRTTGVITAGDGGPAYFLQDMEETGSWNGIAIFDYDMDFEIGDKVTVVGKVKEYYGLTEITDLIPELTTIVSHDNALPDPLVVSTGNLGEQFEGVLLAVENAECVTEVNSYGESSVNDGTGDAVIDDVYYEFEPTLGNVYNVVGPLNYSYGAFKMLPRGAGDIEDITDELLIAPFNLNADVQHRDVVLSWGEPQQPGWVTYYPGPQFYISGDAERGTYFMASDFGWEYPVEISGIRHGFYDDGAWDNDTFIIKIYDADGSTLLFESDEITALPHWQTTEYDLGTTLTLTDNFMVAIVPLVESGAPYSLANGTSTNGYSGGPVDGWSLSYEWSTEVFMSPVMGKSEITTEPTPFVANNSKVNLDNFVELDASEIPFASSRYLKTYNLYRNGSLLADGITDETYTDADLDDGTYSYYVTAVWTVGESSASNVVSVQMFYGTLEGQVVDAEYGVPIPDATITSTDGVYETTSDADGNFVFDEVEYGTHDFDVTADGYYGDTFMEIEIAQNETTTVEFALDREFPAPLNVAVDPYSAIISWNSPFGLTYDDDFEGYTVGDYLAEQSIWTTWDGTAGGATDALISDEQAQSGTKSVKIHDYQETDLVLELGNRTSGVWEVNLSLYFDAAGDGGYYNLLHDFNGGNAEYAYEFMFDQLGSAELTAAGETIPVTYNAGEWNTFKTVVDLDSDNAELYVNGTMVYSWQWSLTSQGAAGLNQLGAMDVFAASLGDSDPFFYMDDVSYGVLQGREVVDTEEAPEFLYYNVYLDDYKVLETNNSSYQYTGLSLNSDYVGSASAVYSYMGDLHESEIIDVPFTFLQTDIVAPRNLTATVSNFSDVVLDWEIPTANRYLESVIIFRDGVEIAQVDGSETTYTDVVCEGMYDYHVQSIYTGFQLSEPSNTATAEVITPAPTNLEGTFNGANTVQLMWDEPTLTPNAYTQGFEGSFPPEGWMKANPDGGTGWEALAVGTSPIPGWNGGEATACPNGGSQMAFATYTTGGTSSNDQWLISPQLEGADGLELSFYMRYFSDLYDDNIDILISTTGTEIDDFDIVVEELNFTTGSSTDWELYTYDLDSYISYGDVFYVAIREHIADNFNDGSAIMLDNFYVGSTTEHAMPENTNQTATAERDLNYVHVPKPDAPYQELNLNSRGLVGYNIYRNDELLATTENTVYLDHTVESGDYDYYVKADYGACESEPTDHYVLLGVNNEDVDYGAVKVYPNPAQDFVNIELTDNVETLRVINYVGQEVYSKTITNEDIIQVERLEAGAYIVRLTTNNGETITKRFVVVK